MFFIYPYRFGQYHLLKFTIKKFSVFTFWIRRRYWEMAISLQGIERYNWHLKKNWEGHNGLKVNALFCKVNYCVLSGSEVDCFLDVIWRFVSPWVHVKIMQHCNKYFAMLVTSTNIIIYRLAQRLEKNNWSLSNQLFCFQLINWNWKINQSIIAINCNLLAIIFYNLKDDNYYLWFQEEIILKAKAFWNISLSKCALEGA